MWDNEDDEDAKNSTGCPYCGAFGCEHHLISIEQTFRYANGGPLARAFNSRWSDLAEAGGDDFDEYAPWLDLVEECEAFAFPSEYYCESGPGTATDVLDLYCPTKDKVKAAVEALQARWNGVGSTTD